MHKEINFEASIEHDLTTAGGYSRGNPDEYDSDLALFPDEVVSFVQRSQPKFWEWFSQMYKVINLLQWVNVGSQNVVDAEERAGYGQSSLSWSAAYGQAQSSFGLDSVAGAIHAGNSGSYRPRTQWTADAERVNGKYQTLIPTFEVISQIAGDFEGYAYATERYDFQNFGDTVNGNTVVDDAKMLVHEASGPFVSEQILTSGLLPAQTACPGNWQNVPEGGPGFTQGYNLISAGGVLKATFAFQA